MTTNSTQPVSASSHASRQRILLLDDDVELCELLSRYLQTEQFEVQVCHDPLAGLPLAASGEFDLILLDIMLPHRNGFDVLRELRATSGTPVIMLTARGEDVDRVIGLEMGADDYVPKPFSSRELAARMRAVLRRSGRPPGAQVRNEIVALDDVRIDVNARSVRRGAARLLLTTVEFDLLLRLLRNAGSVIARDDLFREVLGRRPLPMERSLDVHVSNLRKKLGPDPRGDERIKTLRGAGYLYVRPE